MPTARIEISRGLLPHRQPSCTIDIEYTCLIANMIAEFCNKKLEELTVVIRAKPDLILCICVLHGLFFFVATLGNLLVIQAPWKAKSIAVTLKPMFLSLAFSDLAVGLISHPMLAVIHGVTLNMATKGNFDFERFCPTVITVVMAPITFLVGASFSTTAAIAVDRLLALTIHLRYQELVTEKRVRIGLVTIWIVNFLITFAFMTLPKYNDLVAATCQTVGLLLITVAYFRVYQVVRYHQNQIHSPNEIQNGQAMHFVKVIRSALNAFYVYIVSLVCFTPCVVSGILLEVDNTRISTLEVYNVSAFFILLNSSLNPLVYCWRYREVRDIVKYTLRKILFSNQSQMA